MRHFLILLGLLFGDLSCQRANFSSRGEETLMANNIWASLVENKDVVFNPVPLIAQSRAHTCGAASLLSVLAYYGDNFRESQLEKSLKTSFEGGTSHHEMKKFVLEVLNHPQKKHEALESDGNGEGPSVVADEESSPEDEPYEIEVFPGSDLEKTSLTLREDLGEVFVPKNGMTLIQLESYLRRKKPVIIALQAWRDESQEKESWENIWNSGHYVVVVGFDKDNFYFMDPWFKGSWNYLPKRELVSRWHDVDGNPGPDGAIVEEVRHLALVISRNYQPFNFFMNPIPKMK